MHWFCAAFLTITATAAAASPAWRPDGRAELVDLVRCEALVRTEIVQREKTLANDGRWTLQHQALWRLEAERSLFSAALEATMDDASVRAARKAILPEGAMAIPERDRRRAVYDCAPLAAAIQREGATDGGALDPLPRLSLLSLSANAAHDE